MPSGAVDHPHAALVNPIGAGVVSVATAVGALFLVKVALQQAQTARERHREQTKADRDRRITESFSTATEQLGNDKAEVRLGGIYTLERISRESADDYWTVMETLCAFVRARACRSEPETTSSETMARFYETSLETKTRIEPPTDIAAVLAVIVRRSKENQERERREQLRLDLRATDLRNANLYGANLRSADLGGANLRGADLYKADLSEADLNGADLFGAYLNKADLNGATLIGTTLSGANVSEADLSNAQNLATDQLAKAIGDAKTRLPDGLARPAHWDSEPDATPSPSDTA